MQAEVVHCREDAASRRRQIVYIVGCGRSGSTILGFALGNFAKAVDHGEILDFVKLRGCPNGFGPGTENYEYWSALLPSIERRLGQKLDFDRLRWLQTRVDTHWALVEALIPGWRRALRQEWRDFLRALYDTLLSDPRFELIIDGSKYPSRLWHLQNIYPHESISVIHLLRDPIAVAASRRTDEQSAPKGFISTIAYYLGVNVAARLLLAGKRTPRSYTMFYESFVANPEEELGGVSRAFGLDPGVSLDLIRSGSPLPRGYILNGNRMRLRESIVLRRGAPAVQRESYIKRKIGDALLFLFKPRNPNSL